MTAPLSGADDLYVAHVPYRAPNPTNAYELAAAIAVWLGFVKDVNGFDITVSLPADPAEHEVFCHLKNDEGQRCLLRVQHVGPCR